MYHNSLILWNAGKDIFSDSEGLVIFKDKSFVSDTAVYNKKDKFSSYILRNDYYNLIQQCLASE